MLVFDSFSNIQSTKNISIPVGYKRVEVTLSLSQLKFAQTSRANVFPPIYNIVLVPICLFCSRMKGVCRFCLLVTSILKLYYACILNMFILTFILNSNLMRIFSSDQSMCFACCSSSFILRRMFDHANFNHDNHRIQDRIFRGAGSWVKTCVIPSTVAFDTEWIVWSSRDSQRR